MLRISIATPPSTAQPRFRLPKGGKERAVLSALLLLLSGGHALAEGPPVFVRDWGGFADPVAAAVGPGGEVFVLDAGCPCVRKFDRDGRPLTVWGSRGTGNGQFDLPTDVAVGPDDRVYVSDRGTERIQVFTLEGGLLRTWGVPGLAEGQLDEVRSLSFDAQGTVYLLDGSVGRVQRFTPEGVFLGLSNPSLAPTDHVSVAQRHVVDPFGLMYISYFGFNGSLVLRLDNWGSLIGVLSASEQGDPAYLWAHGLEVDAAGNVYVTDLVRHQVTKFDRGGRFRSQWGGPGSGPGKFDRPDDLAASGTEFVYVVDRGNRRIQQFAVTTLVDAGPAGPGDSRVRLAPVTPNPAPQEAVLEFHLPEPLRVTLTVLDARGRLVRSALRGQELPAGRSRWTWDLRDERGARVAAGVYYARLAAGGRSASRPFVIE